MNLSLSHFLSTDNIRLPGLLYEPTKRTTQVAIFLHGCGSSSIFYKPEMNLWGKLFCQNNISFFPFNNRGAHLIKSLHKETDDIDSERITGGTYYERIADCVHDIDGAVSFLKEKEYDTFYLIGHSTGANKIVVYNTLKKHNTVNKYILLAGGDDTGLNYEMLGKKRFYAALTRAKREIDRGNELKTAPQYLYPEPYSYRALYDVLHPDGYYNTFPFYEYLNNLSLSTKPLFGMYQKMRKPTLIVYGENDDFCYGDVPSCLNVLKKHTTHNMQQTTFRTIPAAGHGFDSFEEELGKLMVNWLR